MRKLNFKSLMAILAAMSMVFFIACESDDPADGGDDNTDPEVTVPVLDEDFSFTVNKNTVEFTTTLTGSVWVTVNDVDHQFEDGAVSVFLANAGTYAFTLSALVDGDVLTSDPFNVVIEQDDKGFLDEGFWLYLSGGANKTKTWKMDMSDVGSVYFDGPIFYSGQDGNPYWSWDVLPDDLPVTVDGTEWDQYFNWSPVYQDNTWLMAAQDYGTITFDATAGTASTTVFGTKTDGSFSFDPETMKLGLTGLVLPIDTARVNEGQFKAEDLANLRIYSLTDSAMQIGIKRSYEGYEDDGVTQKVSEWIMVYNFIVADYNYPVTVPETFTYAEPVNTAFTATDLAGTWNYAQVPFDWVGWTGTGDQGTIKDAVPLNGWADSSAVIGTNWVGITKAQIDAAMAVDYVFNADGSCTIGDVSTTFSVSSGVITFADTVTFNVSDHWFSVSGTEIKVLDAPGTETGSIWIGVKNGDKDESSSVQLVKQ